MRDNPIEFRVRVEIEGYYQRPPTPEEQETLAALNARMRAMASQIEATLKGLLDSAAERPAP